MVSSIICNNHMEQMMTQWLYIIDHRFIYTFMCFINFPEIPWVVRTKTYNVVAQTVFCGPRETIPTPNVVSRCRETTLGVTIDTPRRIL